MYTPVNPSFTIKVWFKGVEIIKVYFRDVYETTDAQRKKNCIWNGQ